MASLGRGELLLNHEPSSNGSPVGNIKSELIDEVNPAAALSDQQIRTRTGGQPAEMVPDGHAAQQGLSSIPHLTSVAAAFYRSDVISGSETSAGRARAMMHKFAVAPARLIDNGGRRAIGIFSPTAATHDRGCIGDE
ncbi:hypothetical protein THAOC_29345 [Thalassiosira oceanica]|uniref:DUF6820 domain-containing protein n=1 Tax=Thalassiosira oceanica TaxID=159749 RepID=K0RRC4_THAOC|nr:hypothetical protein THAOC_29345 [Thalassiosira oceanica]|eukprot:EJK51476.1 hypothetical protein THAOC_29345 [Thalassiosira oceanica]